MTSSKTPGGKLFWHGVIFAIRCLFSLSARVKTYFEAPLPEKGFILATNHISHFDPPLISAAFPRTIDWIAVKELFHGKILTAFFNALSVIPIDRHGTDRGALRLAAKRLAAGRVVGIFPEGGIRDGAASIVNGAPMKGGAAALSAIGNTPIVPGVILGSDRIYNIRRWRPWRAAPVWIGFGTPIISPAELRGEEMRKYIDRELAGAFIRLRDELKTRFSLSDDDLPQPPRQRMKER